MRGSIAITPENINLDGLFIDGSRMIKEFKYKEVHMKIDHDKCTGSTECQQACPMSIMEVHNGKAVCIDISKCISCCACVNACPRGAIWHSMC